MFQHISLPVRLIGMILVTVFLGPLLPLSFIRGCYTLSLCFKEIVSFLLPFIIFTFVFMGLVSLKRNAPFILVLLISFILLSNMVAALLTYIISRSVLPFIISTVCLDGGLSCGVSLEPFFSFNLPTLIRSDYALIGAIISGIFFTFVPSYRLEFQISRIKNKLEYFFSAFFIPILPLYILGFLLKIQYEGVLINLLGNYGGAFLLIVSIQLLCMFLWYFIAQEGNMRNTVQAMRNALASYVMAFSSMSSTATVPVSIQCAEKNTGNGPLANMAMPIMANVHLLGDAVSTPILALVTMLLFYGTFPSLGIYILFAWKFCWSMFAVAGIPAGGIVVMIPVLQSYLGFTPDMISVMMTLYILLDSFGTAANVMGDGALVIMIHKVIKKLNLI